MEYGLRPAAADTTASVTLGLNPCCNGIWSQTVLQVSKGPVVVLILVVMEYGLRLGHTKWYDFLCHMVLILVVMEYGLRQ